MDINHHTISHEIGICTYTVKKKSINFTAETAGRYVAISFCRKYRRKLEAFVYYI